MGWIVAEKKGWVTLGSARKTSTLTGEELVVSIGVNLKNTMFRIACFQNSTICVCAAYFGMFQFLRPFIKVASWLTHIPVILVCFVLLPSDPTRVKKPGSMASSSYVPTGVSLYLIICAKPRPPINFPVASSELKDSVCNS